jgi:hypothetical protein
MTNFVGNLRNPLRNKNTLKIKTKLQMLKWESMVNQGEGGRIR